jgi:hypothetical protein
MKNRRVGTFTLGVSLVVAGILSILSLFTKLVDIFMVMKLSPLILVSLGIEILISTAVCREDEMRIDGWAILVNFILISGTLLSTAAVVIADHYNLIT